MWSICWWMCSICWGMCSTMLRDVQHMCKDVQHMCVTVKIKLSQSSWAGLGTELDKRSFTFIINVKRKDNNPNGSFYSLFKSEIYVDSACGIYIDSFSLSFFANFFFSFLRNMKDAIVRTSLVSKLANFNVTVIITPSIFFGLWSLRKTEQRTLGWV